MDTVMITCQCSATLELQQVLLRGTIGRLGGSIFMPGLGIPTKDYADLSR
jgi:hypothetical protein